MATLGGDGHLSNYVRKDYFPLHLSLYLPMNIPRQGDGHLLERDGHHHPLTKEEVDTYLLM